MLFGEAVSDCTAGPLCWTVCILASRFSSRRTSKGVVAMISSSVSIFSLWVTLAVATASPTASSLSEVCAGDALSSTNVNGAVELRKTSSVPSMSCDVSLSKQSVLAFSLAASAAIDSSLLLSDDISLSSCSIVRCCRRMRHCFARSDRAGLASEGRLRSLQASVGRREAGSGISASHSSEELELRRRDEGSRNWMKSGRKRRGMGICRQLSMYTARTT